MFLRKAGTNPATLTRRDTLDAAFFEDHEDFSQEYARLVADETVPDDPLSTDGFMDACFTFAMERGVGFMDWVYPVYAGIFASLSPEMQEQVEADKYGNLIELFENIDLALRRTEIFSTSELKKIFFGLTMEKDGAQNVMKFLAKVKNIVARLEKAGSAPNAPEQY